MNTPQSRASDFHKRANAHLRAVFESGDEADLVARLRADKVLTGEVVLEAKMKLVTDAALSKMTSPKGWYCLTPVAVGPEVQARAVRLQSRYPVKYTLLAGPGDDVPKETLIYPAAFDNPD
jgi:putative acetyltransferase